jgi:3-oxoadipyl-CoA thiolase
VSRADQDAFALRSQQRTAAAQGRRFFAEESSPCALPTRKAKPWSARTSILAPTPLETLARLKPVNGPDKTVTAGNASGVNDGAAALILASAEAVKNTA